MSKLTAFILAFYLFFSGLIYGNESVKVEILESPFDDGPIICEVPHHPGGVFNENGKTVTYYNTTVNWAFKCKNTGRPIKGESHYEINYSLRSTRPDTPPIRVLTVSDDTMGHDVLIRHNETVCMYAYFVVPADTPAGVWSVVVNVYGSPEVVYENAFIIK